jgi:hypothetical protein
MILGTLQASFRIPDSFSLKDKRSVMNSLKGRLKSRFNVSVAETELLDDHSTGVLGCAVVANETGFIHETLSKIVSFMENDKRIVLMDVKTEVL